jgi:hypothetical protein
MRYRSNSAASELSPARFGLRIVRAMQPSAACGETAECVAKVSPGPRSAEHSFVANSIVSSGDVGPGKAIVRRGAYGRLGLWLAVR